MLRRSIPYWATGKRGGGADPNAIFNDATIVHSMQKLISAYSGFCWRVRRVSDNTLHDIGFDGTGWVDESELTTILGAGIGRLNIFYDQKESNNLTGLTTTAEPLIWNNGFIIGHNGLPAIDFEGTNLRNLDFASSFNMLTSGGFFLAVATFNDDIASQQILSNSGVNIQFRLRKTATTTRSEFTAQYVDITTSNKIFSLYIEPSGDYDMYADATISITTQTGLLTATFNQIGLRQVSGEPFRSTMQEFIYFSGTSYTILDIINNRLAVYTP